MGYCTISTTMIFISNGKGILRLLPRLGATRNTVKRGYTTKPLPTDLAGLIPSLEDLGLGSGDNGTRLHAPVEWRS
jgi:hypothetical protein